jgi:geranylgeranyl pyrophosphate synthase
MDFQELEGSLESFVKEINETLKNLLPEQSFYFDPVPDAISYVVLMEGCHRWRPFVLKQCIGLLGKTAGSVEFDKVSPVLGAALEMIHNFSIIHDDLPQMDDDEIRRGKESCHMKFGDGIALLTGSALIFQAFKIISNLTEKFDKEKLLQIINTFARYTGTEGLIAGQSIDLMILGDVKCSEEEYKKMVEVQLKKTTSLFILACRIACILCCTPETPEHQTNALSLYGRNLGLIYQLLDDMRDSEGKSAITEDQRTKVYEPQIEKYLEEINEVLSIFPKNVYHSRLLMLPHYWYHKYETK